jgi:predicted amidophosphoribosyltransferase
VSAPAGLDALAVALRYESAGRDLLHLLKFANRRASVGWLGLVVSVAIERAGIDVALVTWAPTSAERRRRRGFDQAEVLARAVARELRLPARPLLRRGPGPSGPQTGRSAADRLRGPSFVPRAWAERAAQGRSVLLVDDVCTTGATLRAAAATLRQMGASGVSGAVAAHTPLKAGPGDAENR